MIKWLLVLLVGCASSQKGGLNLPPGFDYSIRNLAHQSLDESRKTITNKRNFLLALFEQSFDPYYGTPRWSEQCLAANRIGELKENSRGIYAASHLYMPPNLEPGFCPEVNYANPYYVVLFQCVGTNALMEVRVSAKSFDPKFDWTTICN